MIVHVNKEMHVEGFFIAKQRTSKMCIDVLLINLGVETSMLQSTLPQCTHPLHPCLQPPPCQMVTLAFLTEFLASTHFMFAPYARNHIQKWKQISQVESIHALDVVMSDMAIASPQITTWISETNHVNLHAWINRRNDNCPSQSNTSSYACTWCPIQILHPYY